MSRLILFDVDGTLIKRGDPDHLAAMDVGVHSIFPDAAEATVMRVDFDGKVDRLIATEVLSQAGIRVRPDDPALDRVFHRAGDAYREVWQTKSGGDDDLLPGVADLVSELHGDPRFALAVMTGGSRPIVEVKLKRLGLADRFPVGSFGDEVPDRPSLVPLAVERAESHYAASFDPDDCVVVGDTPADVHCAHVHGIACLGTATGKYSVADLRRAGADAVVETLGDTGEIISRLSSLVFKRTTP